MIAGILLAGILAVTLAGCKNTDNTKEETEKPVITLGSDNYPPYNYLNEDGVPTGIDVELATEAFKRMGYQVEVVQINWEDKKELVESGEIDCIMGCFSMEGRLDDYRWAGPYIASRQVVAVNENSDIYKLSDLEGKNLAVQSTTKPESIFLNRTDDRIPKLAKTIPIIAMTANAFSEDIQHSLAAGMNAHVSKPVEMKVLEKTIRSIKSGGGGTEPQVIEQ